MTNRYRVASPATVHVPNGTYVQGDEFDHEFTEEDETRAIADGLIEIVPRTYKVIGGSNVHGADPGGTFTAALTVGVEALLFAGGHIERVDKPAPAKPTPSKAKE